MYIDMWNTHLLPRRSLTTYPPHAEDTSLYARRKRPRFLLLYLSPGGGEVGAGKWWSANGGANVFARWVFVEGVAAEVRYWTGA